MTEERRFRPAPPLLDPWAYRFPEVEKDSTSGIFAEDQQGIVRDYEHWRVLDQMKAELHDLEVLKREQAAETKRLTAENKHLHQSRFKPRITRITMDFPEKK